MPYSRSMSQVQQVLDRVGNTAQAVKVLADAGVIRPMRPEKLVHMALDDAALGPDARRGLQRLRRPAPRQGRRSSTSSAR